MKQLEWLGSSRSDLKSFEEDARREAGHQLLFVQMGLEPTDWKPMPSVALGVNEIRIHKRTANRVLYVAKFANAIYVLHCFVKKTQKTDPRDIEIARKRYAELVESLKKSRQKS